MLIEVKKKTVSLQEDWYVVQTKPFQEEKVIFYLRQSGINILLALFDHWKFGKERVCLLLSLINGQVKITVPTPLVETVEKNNTCLGVL